MYDHFIVPVDLSDRNAGAIDTARELARLTGGRVTLMHVVETLDLPYDEVAEFYARLEESAAGKLESLLEPLKDSGVEFERRIVFGDPAEEIIDFAAQSADSLIVLRSHRVDPSTPTHGWATLSYKLAILATSPILLVKRDDPN
ncbi:MAG: universal stress protein [Gemmatimonadota bacterium]|nr:universal stress protein [Gemmatimonadota bacterium]MDH3427006.1 universal stress protein [Gemmatimonadota bacterium]